ncbi:unnamed protein product [Dibothriocephalus latus]|uniref:Uncharacterized protein n=1 Tax=Dibothriocephalus latus TaxID=60516 RepID=A0A3P6SUY7_DIBLA|nr:unnamed protein product [Dibothriocephalus latus]
MSHPKQERVFFGVCTQHSVFITLSVQPCFNIQYQFELAQTKLYIVSRAERERFLQIEPAQNRASILRRVHGEQRRAEAEILSMNLAARMASTLSLDSGQWTPSGASSPRQQETSQVSQPSVSASSVEARRKAVEAALRRLGRSS